MIKIWFDEIDESTINDMVVSLGSLRKVQYLRISFVSKEEKRIQVDGWEDWTPPSVLHELLLVDIALPRRPLWLDSSCVLHLSSLWFEVEMVDEQDLRTLGGYRCSTTSTSGYGTRRVFRILLVAMSF